MVEATVDQKMKTRSQAMVDPTVTSPAAAGGVQSPADEANDRHVPGDHEKQPRTTVAEDAGLLQGERKAARRERETDANSPLPEEHLSIGVRRRTQVAIGSR